MLKHDHTYKHIMNYDIISIHNYNYNAFILVVCFVLKTSHIIILNTSIYLRTHKCVKI